MLLRSSTKTSPKGTYSICCTTSPLRLVSNYCYPNGLGGSRTASSRMRRPLGNYSLQLSTKLVPAQLPSCRHCSRSPYHRHSRCCPRHCTTLRGVGVECLSTIAILQICALLELVVADLAHIIVAVRLPYSHAPIVLYHFSINDYRRFTQ